MIQNCCPLWLINNGQCFDCIFPSSESFFSVCKMKYSHNFCVGRLVSPVLQCGAKASFLDNDSVCLMYLFCPISEALLRGVDPAAAQQ